MAFLYWQDSGSQAWEDVLNWWTDDAATTQAANAPWVNGVDSTYLAYDLTSASGATNAPVIGGSYSAKNIGTGASGICDIINVILDFDSNIYGGTFSGSNFFNNYSYITSGTFSGNDFNNSGTINGGTFSGDNFNNSNAINGGTFSGDNFNNSNAINGGTFSGDNLSNNGTIDDGTFSEYFANYDTINGGTFTGNGWQNFAGGTINDGIFTGSGNQNFGGIAGGTFSNSVDNSLDITGGTFSGAVNNNGYIANGTFTGSVANSNQIDGGTFSGSFINYAALVTNGTFIYPAANLSVSGGNTLFSLTGFGPVFGYPTPASGGGSDQTIARLLNLPWFINI